MDKQLEKLHYVLLEITDYIFKICEENNLTCMLLYGTALGAHRHKGFIPWDDDMDLGMPRDDYEKFIQIMRTKNDGYTIQNEDNEPNYHLAFCKIRKDNTVFLEKAVAGMFKNNGIYVDIFPLDYVENPNSIGYKLKALYMSYIKHIIKFSSCTDLYREKLSQLRFLIELIICFPSKLFSRRKLIKYLHRLMSENGDSTGVYLAQYDDVLSRQIMPIDYYLPSKKIEFEGHIYNVPNKIENYLEKCYGPTYMQLPPEDQRMTHKPLKIEF